MNRNLTSPSAGVTVVQGLKVYEGGTGAVDAAGALANLGAIAKSKINQASGVLGLSSSGKLDINALPTNQMALISLVGPTSMNKGTSASFSISNYDAFTTYVLELIGGGSVIQNGDKISYTAPTTVGAFGFKINGRTWAISVTDYKPNKPTLTGVVVAGSQNHPYLVLTGSAYSMPGSGDTHKNSDWQIATDPAFTAIVSQSLADAANKTTFQGNPGNVNTTYYARVRYRSSGDFLSDWSDSFVVLTAANYLVNKEVQKVVIPDRPTALIGGTNQMAMSGDGTRLAFGGPTNTNAAGVYVFVKSGNLWILETKLTNPVMPVASRYGIGVAIDETGTRLVVGADLCTYVDGNGVTRTAAGAVFVYKRDANTWTLEQMLTSTVVNSNLGNTVNISGDGTRIFVMASIGGGIPHMYVRSGTTWTLEQVLTKTAAPSTAQFGLSSKISKDGLRCVAGDLMYDAAKTGAVYIFRRDGTVWSQEAIVQPGDHPANSSFGYMMELDATATRLAVSAFNDSTNAANAGAVYIFLRTGTSWAQEAKLVASNRKANDQHYSVVFNADGSKLASGAIVAGVQGDPRTTTGVAYIWSRTGINWVQDAMFTGSDSANGDQFGRGVCMNYAGDSLVVSAYNNDGFGAQYSFSA